MPPKPADVRFYFDADVLLLARVLADLRSDVTYPGDPGGACIDKRVRPACPITSQGTPDHEWIPEVAQRGWLTVTRDRAITRRPAETNAVAAYGARLVILSGQEAGTTFKQLEIVMSQWRAIERLAGQEGPFAYTATRTSLVPIELGEQL